MPAQAIETVEQYAPRVLFQKMGGFSAPDFTGFCARNNIEKDESTGDYPVFAIINALNAERKSRRGSKGNTDLESELKTEKILEARIKNQRMMGTLIPIVDARIRVRETLMAVANMIKYATKTAAPRVAISNNVRDCENILVESYNGSIEELKRKSKIQDWEDMGANTQLRGTGMLEDSEEDLSTGSGEEDSFTFEG